MCFFKLFLLAKIIWQISHSSFSVLVAVSLVLFVGVEGDFSGLFGVAISACVFNAGEPKTIVVQCDPNKQRWVNGESLGTLAHGAGEILKLRATLFFARI